MRIVIEGNSRQIKDACRIILSEGRVTPRTSSRVEATKKRRLIRDAFDIIRDDPSQNKTVDAMAKALGGSGPMDDDLLAIAAAILRVHSAR